MKRRLNIAVAAALAAGGFSWATVPAWAEDAAQKAGQAADNAADTARNAADTTADAARDAADNTADATRDATQAASDSVAAPAAKPTFPAGIKLKESAGDEDRTGILKTIDNATQAAFTKDGFNDLVERLVDQDRNRLGKDGYTDKSFDDLNAKAEAFQKAWKAKYGSNFKIKGSDSLASVTTICGEIEDPAAVASAWPVAAVVEGAGEAVPAAAKDAAAVPGTTEQNIDSNVEKGRDVAIAAVPASHGLPAINVSLIQEAGGYRIDLPNTLTAQQLHDSLLNQITHVTDMQAQWPADQKDAEAAVAHHVLLGIYGVDIDKAAASASPDAAGTDTGAGAADPKTTSGLGADK